MKCFLSIIILSVLFCSRGASVEALGIASVRQPGASLDISIRHEADNARRLAAEWLVARQLPDGSWGSTNANTVLTPIVWFALKGMDDAIDAVARDRAVVWLDSQPMDASAPFDAHLWRLLMMRHAFPDAPELQARAGLLLLAMKRHAPDAPAYSHWLWREAEADPRTRPEPLAAAAQRQLDIVAPDYPLKTQNPETFWHFARLINRYAGGVWVHGADALDWRNGFGLALINAQRKDPSGGGCWNAPTDAPTDDAKLRATAFALLALREID